MLHIQLVAPALAAIALVASGCGGSSKTGSATAATVTTIAATTTTTPAIPPAPTTSVTVAVGRPLTHAHLIAAAEAICLSQHKKLSTVTIQSESDYSRLAPQVAIYDSTELHELSKLVPPTSMDKRWLEVLTLDQLFSEYINRIANYAQAKNYKAAAPLLKDAEDTRRRLAALTKSSGIKDCSELG
jgi:hypothetical protein